MNRMMAAARLGAGLCVVALGFGAASAQAQSQSVKGTFGSAAFQSGLGGAGFGPFAAVSKKVSPNSWVR